MRVASNTPGNSNIEPSAATDPHPANDASRRRGKEQATINGEPQPSSLRSFVGVGGGRHARGLDASSTTVRQATTHEQLSSPEPAHEPPQLGNIPPRPKLTGPTPNITTMTPGATYRHGVTADDVKEKLEFQAGYARYQWATGQGVVGPVGKENQGIYAAYNDPADPNFPRYQQFGYHHDMQAADAQLQRGGFSYDVTLATSALRGMDVLQATGDVDRALEAARREWRSSGFDVRQRY